MRGRQAGKTRGSKASSSDENTEEFYVTQYGKKKGLQRHLHLNPEGLEDGLTLQGGEQRTTRAPIPVRGCSRMAPAPRLHGREYTGNNKTYSQ